MVRLSALGFALAAAPVLVPRVVAQIPACATSCAESSAATTGCDRTDTICLCDSGAYGTSVADCVQSTCDPADHDSALEYLFTYFGGLCGTSSSVTLPSSGVSTSTSPAVTSSTSTTRGTLPTTTTTSNIITTTSPTSPSSSSNHAARDQPAGMLGAGLALVLALFCVTVSFLGMDTRARGAVLHHAAHAHVLLPLRYWESAMTCYARTDTV